jgi:hypothetical protein
MPVLPMTNRPILLLKRALLAFWAVWLTVVLATNVLDAAKAVGALGPGWTFASGNYAFLAETTSRYGTPPWLIAVLFAGVIAWQGLAAVLFWRACLRFREASYDARRSRYAAFTVSLLLWAAFLVADEVFIAYAVAATHLRLFTAQLVTLLAIELLPEAGTVPRP